MSIGTILLIVLILMLIGVIPAWPHSRSWGYGPSGVLGIIVVVLVAGHAHATVCLRACASGSAGGRDRDQDRRP